MAGNVQATNHGEMAADRNFYVNDVHQRLPSYKSHLCEEVLMRFAGESETVRDVWSFSVSGSRGSPVQLESLISKARLKLSVITRLKVV